MDVTYIGHQTLLVESHGIKVLIDPVFRERMPEERVSMYPAKVLDDAQLLPVHAVVITHTHLDHVDYEAFERINKDALLFVSCISYGRLAPLLADHGFDPAKIVPLQPTGQVRLGKLRIGGALFGRQANEQGLGEPDVTPVVLHDGESGLCNFVDIFPHEPEAVQRVAEAFGPLTAVITAWNFTRSRTDILSGPLDREAELATMGENLAGLFETFGVPNAFVVGNGFVLDSQYAPFNAHLFPIPKPELCARVNTAGPVAFHALEVGRTYHLRGDTVSAGELVPWLTRVGPEDAQAYQPSAPVPRAYTPFTERGDLTRDELVELEAFLDGDYASYLRFRYLPQFFFAGLVYQGGYHEGLGLILDQPRGPLGYRFVRTPEGVECLECDSRAEVLASHVWVEMAARDFLALIRGDIVLIDPVYYDLRSHPEFLDNIVAPRDALFREPMGIFDPFYHGKAVTRAVLGPQGP